MLQHMYNNIGYPGLGQVGLTMNINRYQEVSQWSCHVRIPLISQYRSSSSSFSAACFAARSAVTFDDRGIFQN